MRYAFAGLVLILGFCQIPAVRGQVVINEILLDGTDDVIELKNQGATQVDVSSWWICYQPAYRQISSLTVSGSTLMNPGDEVRARRQLLETERMQLKLNYDTRLAIIRLSEATGRRLDLDAEGNPLESADSE